MRVVRAAGVAVAALAALATAVVVTAGDSPPHDSGADRAALRANATAGAASFAGEYTRLVDLLPNATLPDGSSSTDSVVLGTVSSVEPEAGYDEVTLPNAPAPGRPGARVTAFDDPLADWRTLRVVIDVQETLAGPSAPQVELSWVVFGSSRNGEDAVAIGRALKDLGTVVILSKGTPPGPEHLGIERDVPGKEGGVLQVSADGSLSLPLAGGSGRHTRVADPAAFLQGVETLDKLRAQAAKPARSSPAQG